MLLATYYALNYTGKAYLRCFEILEWCINAKILFLNIPEYTYSPAAVATHYTECTIIGSYNQY